MSVRLYQGLTYDTYKGALATAQGMYFSALGNNDVKGVERWGAEEARLTGILNHWETISKEQD